MCDKNGSPKNNYNSTPPTNRKVRNPFDRVLIERLHNPICSPGMCKIYKKKKSGSFGWDIDQACTLVPADIVACNSQFEPSPDSMLEKIAEEATERFFSQGMVMPSPLESSKKTKPLQISSESTSLYISTSSVKTSVVMKDVSAQTILTLPPELPPEIEKILQPFCTFTQDQNISGDYEITANGSLRRKLFFESHSDAEHYDSEQTDEEVHVERPPSSYEPHTPILFSPDLSRIGPLSFLPRCRKRRLKYTNANSTAHAEKENSDRLLKPSPTRLPSVESMANPSCEGGPYPAVDELQSRDLVSKGMKRTFGTPLNKVSSGNGKPYRNKILDVVEFGEPCFSPIQFQTPKRNQDSVTSSVASSSISPVTKVTSSDEEKNNFTSPESEAMATCLDCIHEPESETKGPCFCKQTPKKSTLKRSASLKESQPKSRKSSFSFSEKRSLSMSSLHRSKSVQKLDFSMDMSIDGSSFLDHSQADSESSPLPDKEPNSGTPEETWSHAEDTGKRHTVKVESFKEHVTTQSISKIDNILDGTPIRSKSKRIVLSHEISKIRAPINLSAGHMSLDGSLDSSDNPLDLEDKKIDFNTVDLKFLTDNVAPLDSTHNAAKACGDSSTSFKRIDSGFNENTFYVNASSYYESAIKPSELTVTNISKCNSSKTVLKEISNVPWMRVDSGFNDGNSGDSMQFYTNNESSMRKVTSFRFSEAQVEDKENVAEEFDKFLIQASSKNEAMSMSEYFSEDMTFNCNFSSTPSKNKPRKF